MQLHLNRRALLNFALAMQSDDHFFDVFHDPRVNQVDQNCFLCLREWGRCGAQSVVMPETYVAALAATDVVAAITPTTQLPWPAFEIVLPPRFLTSSHGDIWSVIAIQTPNWVKPRQGLPHHYILMYSDGASFGMQTFPELVNVVHPEGTMPNLGVSQFLMDSYDHDREKRIWQVIGRIVGGVLLAIENARQEKPVAYAAKPPKMRGAGTRRQLEANTFQLGKPLKLDLRPQIREYIDGVYRGGGVPSVRTLVRGHWKKQPYGPRSSLRKNIAIAPYFRGDGPTLVRPMKMDPGDELDGLDGDDDADGFDELEA